MSGLGAGVDSFYEYLLKAYILFGHERDLQLFVESRQKLQENLRRGRKSCYSGSGDPPFYANVDMRDGSILNTWVDALQVKIFL